MALGLRRTCSQKFMQGFVERVIAPRIVPLDQDLLLL